MIFFQYDLIRSKNLYIKIFFRKEELKSNIVSLNHEKTKLEENLVGLKKKHQDIQTKFDPDIYKQLDKKDRLISEIKGKLELKEQ